MHPRLLSKKFELREMEGLKFQFLVIIKSECFVACTFKLSGFSATSELPTFHEALHLRRSIYQWDNKSKRLLNIDADDETVENIWNSFSRSPIKAVQYIPKSTLYTLLKSSITVTGCITNSYTSFEACIQFKEVYKFFAVE